MMTVNFLDRPIKWRQLFNDVHHDLVVVLWLEDLELLIRELIYDVLTLQLLQILIGGAWLATGLTFSSGVLVCSVATNSHLK